MLEIQLLLSKLPYTSLFCLFLVRKLSKDSEEKVFPSCQYLEVNKEKEDFFISFHLGLQILPYFTRLTPYCLQIEYLAVTMREKKKKDFSEINVEISVYHLSKTGRNIHCLFI